MWLFNLYGKKRFCSRGSSECHIVVPLSMFYGQSLFSCLYLSFYSLTDTDNEKNEKQSHELGDIFMMCNQFYQEDKYSVIEWPIHSMRGNHCS